ncbi:CoA ester lyase, partial [Streptomyces sp. NPDC058171]
TSALGFDGKWVIHPAQVESAAAAFTPTDTAVEDARRVIDALAAAEAAGAGAAQLDGQMLDEAVAVAARRVLAQVGAR